MKTVVERFNLNKWLGQEEAREKLVQAGYRGQAPYVTFLFFRMVMPVAMLAVLAVLCVPGPRTRTADDDQARDLPGGRLSRHACSHISSSRTGSQNRQLSIKRAFPDALDLLLICVESGMSIEPRSAA